jgi:hypothetical protein
MVIRLSDPAVRDFVKLATEWCLGQEDLSGFHIHSVSGGAICVSLDWPSDFHARMLFWISDLPTISLANLHYRLATLRLQEETARKARAREPDQTGR